MPGLPALLLAGAAVAVAFVGAALLAARRFARRREREGLWNAEGPIHPSEPPPGWGSVPAYGVHRPEIESEPAEPPEREDRLD